MRLHELREKRAKLIKEMREIAAGSELSDEQRSLFDAKKTEVEAIEAQIARVEFLDDADRRAQGTPITGDGARGDRFVSEVRANFSLTRALAMAVGLPQRQVDWGRERELCDEARARGMRDGLTFQGEVQIPLEAFERRVVTSAPGSGSGVISTDLRPGDYIDRLRAALVTQRLGARVLGGLTGNVAIPKNTSGDTATWFTENSALSAANKSFGQVTLSPKHVGMITEYSRNMLLQSSPDIEQLLRDDFANELARAVDRAALSGDGNNGSPIGITRASGTQSFGLMGSGANWAGVLNLISAVENVNSAFTGWAMGSAVKSSFMQTPKQSSGIEGNFIMTDPGTLAGYPVAISNLTVENDSPANHTLIGGAWSDLLIGYWSTLDVLVNPFESTAYAKGNVQIRGIISCDVALRHAESFAFEEDVGPA